MSDLPENSSPWANDPQFRELFRMSESQLLGKLGEGLKMILGGTLLSAIVIGRLDQMGKLPEHYARHPITPYMLKIYWGQLRQEVLETFGLHQTALDRISRLPAPDQLRAADLKHEFPVARSDGTSYMCAAVNMNSEVRRLVFADGHVRSLEEQFAILQAKGAPRPLRDAPEVRIDRHRNGAWVGEVWLSRTRLKNILDSLEK